MPLWKIADILAIMNYHVQTMKTYIGVHKKVLAISTAITLGFVSLIALFIYNNPQIVVYQPTNACNLLTPAKAQSLLGDKVISLSTDAPVVSGNTAISKCSYTDNNPDKNLMMVAAVAVRSGINDKGIQQNKTEFATSRSSKDVEAVKDLGDSAYFNQTLGQLNIIDGRRWIILSNGLGSTPDTNTLDKTVELAKKILQ
jgi:hypothetical protein